jgi:hypothetical protein
VTFDKVRPEVEKIESKDASALSGKATRVVTFSEPVNCLLHVVANDYSGDGGGGFQCCWTNGQVNVLVQPLIRWTLAQRSQSAFPSAKSQPSHCAMVGFEEVGVG